MNIIVERWIKDKYYFGIRNYRKAWKEVGNKPRICFHHNGGKKKNGDMCFDATLIIGYTIFNFTNFNLQGGR